MNNKYYNLFFINKIKKKNLKKEKILFSGEWCLFDKNKIYNNKKYRISSREEQINLINSVKVCDKIYERLIVDLIYFYKKNFNINWNKRSWEIFLGPWLKFYVSIIYDRYNIIKYLFKKYKIKKIQLSENQSFNLLTQNISEFRESTQEDEWNLKLFTKLYLKYFKKKNIAINKEKLNFNNLKFNLNNKYNLNLLLVLKNKLINFLIQNFKKYFNIVFYKTYFNNKKKLIFILAKKKKLYFPYNFNYNIPKSDCLSELRNKKINSKFKLQKIEVVLRELFFELVPFYYLEKINILKYLNNVLVLPPHKNCKIISSTALWFDGIFKYWLADAINKNSKLIYLQHGCHYGSTKYLYAEDLEIKLSDKFLTWGWKKKNKKLIQFYCTRTFFLKEKKFNNNKNYLIVISNIGIYRSYFSTGALSTKNTLNYLNHIFDICKFFKNQKNIYFRLPPPKKNSLKIETLLKKNFTGINFDKKNYDFIKSTERYGLIIFTYHSTAFLEAISLNKPSILLISNKIYKNLLRKDSLKYYNKLEKVKIIFTSTKKLNKFLNKKKFDLKVWWYNKITQDSLSLFRKQFCNQTNRPEKKLLEII